MINLGLRGRCLACVEGVVVEGDWRRTEACEGSDELSPAVVAWELLRRYPGYRVDYRTFLDKVASGAGAEAECRRFARGGLAFCGRSDAVGA